MNAHQEEGLVAAMAAAWADGYRKALGMPGIDLSDEDDPRAAALLREAELQARDELEADGVVMIDVPSVTTALAA